MCFWQGVKAAGRLACCVAAIGLSALSAAQVPASATSGGVHVTAFNTYLLPPFVYADGHGLAADLVHYLNRRLAPDYVLVLKNLPRSRFVKTELLKEAAFDGVSLFLAPAFVGDTNQVRYLWSPPLFIDYNVLVFKGSEAPKLRGSADLVGKSFAGIRDHRYAVLDDMASAGKLVKMENNTEEGNLRMLLAGRVDFTQMDSLGYHVLSNEAQLAGQLSAIPKPDEPVFARHILVGKAQAALAKRINEVVANMPCEDAFRALSREYGFQLGDCSKRPPLRK